MSIAFYDAEIAPLPDFKRCQRLTPVSPLVDILMPVHNSALFVAEAIESVRAQTETSWRLLILDDGSTDDTVAIANEFAARDPRIEIFRYPKRGLVLTLNDGLALCKAPYIARQDGDDISFPNRFEIELKHFNDNPDCIAVSGGLINIDTQGKPLSAPPWSPNPELSDPYWIPAREPYLIHAFLMMRSEVFKRLGYRNFFICEDADLCWRLQETGKIKSLKQAMGYYRVHENSISTHPPVNTRVQAIMAQLGAIGAQRRREGHGDLVIEASLYERMVDADNFLAILEIFRPQLSPAEFRYLHAASIIKLVETVTYRPSRINPEELRIAYEELYDAAMRPWSGRDSIVDICCRAASTLRKRGEPELAQLLTPGIWGWLIMRMKQIWLIPATWYLPPLRPPAPDSRHTSKAYGSRPLAEQP